MDQNNIEKIKLLEQENELLKQKLSNYTNSSSYKKYYEANKDKINEKKRERAKINYENNKELIRQKQKEYYEKTKKEKI
jgi:hypothetical protein